MMVCMAKVLLACIAAMVGDSTNKQVSAALELLLHIHMGCSDVHQDYFMELIYFLPEKVG